MWTVFRSENFTHLIRTYQPKKSPNVSEPCSGFYVSSWPLIGLVRRGSVVNLSSWARCISAAICETTLVIAITSERIVH